MPLFFFIATPQNNKTKMGLHREGMHFGNVSTESILILPHDETRNTGAFCPASFKILVYLVYYFMNPRLTVLLISSS